MERQPELMAKLEGMVLADDAIPLVVIEASTEGTNIVIQTMVTIVGRFGMKEDDIKELFSGIRKICDEEEKRAIEMLKGQ